jgi:hypothetical protein
MTPSLVLLPVDGDEFIDQSSVPSAPMKSPSRTEYRWRDPWLDPSSMTAAERYFLASMDPAAIERVQSKPQHNPTQPTNQEGTEP